jgi:hypothetical protein
MTPRLLGEIGLRPGDHLSTLWWLGLLYRRPPDFAKALVGCPWPRSAIVALCLYLHALPYILVLTIAGRLFVFAVLGLPFDPRLAEGRSILTGHITSIAVGLAFGMVLGLAFGLAFGLFVGITGGTAGEIAVGLAFGLAFGLPFGIAVGIAGGIAFGLAFGIAGGLAVGLAFGISFGLAVGTAFGIAFEIGVGIGVALGVGLAFGLAFGIVYGIGGGIGGGLALGIALGIAFGIAISRTFYMVVHSAFLWPRVRGDWYRFHPVAWDDLCLVPFPGLDRLLTAFAEREPEAGTTEIKRLFDTYPSQRVAALRAGTRLIAREAGGAGDLARLSDLVAELPEGEKGFLSQTLRLREMVGEIAGLQARLDAVDRPVLRDPLARLLRSEIENFQHRVSGFHEPLASEFRAAAANWLTIAQRQLNEARAAVHSEPTPQVFRAGDPVNRQQEAFVPRGRVVGKLEQQVLLSTGCPGIVLYGRRRMGKSTVLRNLNGFLPPSVRVVTISMQRAEAFVSLASLVALLTESLRRTWPGDHPPDPSKRDLPALSRLLVGYNEALGAAGRRLILAFDEYENIDRKLGEGVFPEDLLALIRDSIQSHRNLTWAFAGSHEINELTEAPWTSYLVSARTIEVPPFTEAETRLLLTEPLKSSTLWPKDDPSRPRPTFPAEFWGHGGIERIHAEAGGWPHLVQLIAETLVDLLNDKGQSRVNAELFDRALEESVVRGHNVLYELMHRESTLPGEWEYIEDFRRQESRPPPDDDAVRRSLRRRLLFKEEGIEGPWRLRVPLMRRWLNKRG